MSKFILIWLMLMFFEPSTTVRPLKAMLYCFLPSTPLNWVNQYKNLAYQIQQYLNLNSINVEVVVCGTTPGLPDKDWLYDMDNIHRLFDYYDIINIDTLWLQYFNKSTLFHFDRYQIDPLMNTYEVLWKPLTIDGIVAFGSPSLMCSDFILSRNKAFESQFDILVANYDDEYNMGRIYLGLFLNKYPDKTESDIDFEHPEQSIVDDIKSFLKKCQTNQTSFDYNSNNCLNSNSANFYTSKIYKSTLGYSENLYNFFTTFPGQAFTAQHAFQGKTIKLIYQDCFIAKIPSFQEQEETIKQFYSAMLSDEIISLYTKGLYLNPQKLTYLLPPTKSSYSLISNDSYNSGIHSELFEFGQENLHLVYRKKFTEKFGVLLDKILELLKIDN